MYIDKGGVWLTLLAVGFLAEPSLSKCSAYALSLFLSMKGPRYHILPQLRPHARRGVSHPGKIILCHVNYERIEIDGVWMYVA